MNAFFGTPSKYGSNNRGCLTIALDSLSYLTGGGMDRWTAGPALFLIYTCTRARVYFIETAGPAARRSTLTLRPTSAVPSPNSTILKISPAATSPQLFRGSIAGLPRVESKSNPPQKYTIVKISLTRSAPRSRRRRGRPRQGCAYRVSSHPRGGHPLGCPPRR